MVSGLARTAAIAGICALIGLLAVRVALVLALPPAIAAQNPLMRAHPLIADKALWAHVGAAGDKQPDPQLQLSVANRLPLSGSPFAVEGLETTGHAGDLMLEEAQRRDPRKRHVRLLLIQSYAREGKVDEVAAELVTLSRLMPNFNEMFVAQLAQLSINSQTSRAIRQALKSSDLLEGVLNYMARQGAPPSAILNMAEGRVRTLDRDPVWKSYIVRQLIDTGDVDGAHETWLDLFSVQNSDDPIYDAQFRQLPGGPPFNWSFGTSEVGAAEPTGRGGLDVVYYGRQSGQLASQLLRLEPGRYRLSVVFEGSKRDGAGSVRWTVNCNGSDDLLLDLPMTGPQYDPRRLSGAFTVPANCPAQWLLLAAKAAEFPVASDMRLTQLTIAPAR